MTLFPPHRYGARACIALAGLAALAACADQSGYPSLAPRAVELPGGAGSSAEAASTVIPVDPALEAKVAELIARAQTGDAAFASAAADGCKAAARARGASEGSEAWIGLQQALSALDAARAPVLAAAAELDQLVIERGTATATSVDTSRLAAAQEQVSAMDVAQQSRMTELAAGSCSG